MRVSYVSLVGVPSTAASMVNVLKMANAFVANGVDLELSMPSRNVRSSLKEIDGFGVNIPRIRFLPAWFGRGIFVIVSLVRAKLGNRFVYSRAPEVSFAASVLGLKNVIEVHSPYRERNVLARWMFQLALLSHNTVKVVAISEALKRLLIQYYGISPKKIAVLHDGADLESHAQVLASDIKDVGYIGHLYPGRGIEVILKLAEKFPQQTFHIVGGRDDEVEYWKKNEVPGNVVFYGHVNHDEASRIRHRMHVLLAPYQGTTKTRAGVESTQWMSPIKIFEYMASGIPMVASDLPVLREVLHHRTNCLLAHPSSFGEWENALSSLIQDKPLRERLAQSAQNDIRDNYSWKNRAHSVIKIIQSNP